MLLSLNSVEMLLTIYLQSVCLPRNHGIDLEEKRKCISGNGQQRKGNFFAVLLVFVKETVKRLP